MKKTETAMVKTGESKLKELNAIMESNLTDMKLWATKFPFPAEKTRRILEIENLPLDGINFIEQRDSSGKLIDIKLYINSLGASVKAEQKAEEKNLELAGVKTELIESDKQVGRCVVKATLTIRDKKTIDKIIDKAEKLPEKILEKLLDACIFKYEAFGSHSFQKEKNPANKEMSSILKKSETQAVRRANLKFAPPYIFKADEGVDGEEEIIEATATITDAKLETPQEPELKPDTVEKVEEVHDKKPKKEKEPNKKEKTKEELPEEEKTGITYEQIVERMKKMNYTIGQITMWFMKKFHAKNIKELTVENLIEADKLISEQEKSGKKSDPARTQKIKKVFAIGLKTLEMDEDSLRSWCKETWGKGLSEMSEDEIQVVIDELGKMTG